MRLLVLFLFLSFSGLCQDLIVFKDGSRISCRIMAIDSSSIYYRIVGTSVKAADRANVQKYFLSRKTQSRLYASSSPTIAAEEKDLFHFSGGGAVVKPLNEFASMDATSESSGLAMTGRGLFASLLFKATPVLGIKIAYRSQRNQLDSEPVRQYYATRNPGVEFNCEGGDWRMGGIFAGLGLRVPLNDVDGLYLLFDAEVGLPRFHFADITLTGYTQNSMGIVEWHAFPVSAVAVSLGAGVSIRMADNLRLNITGDYFQSKPRFSVSIRENHTFTESVSYTQKISTFNIGAGLSIILNRR